MLQDGNSLSISGGILVAGLLYAGACLFVTGPVIGERTIAKSNWGQQCKATLRAEIRADEPAPTFTPKLNCSSIFGGLFGNEGKAWCRQYGGRFTNPIAGQLEKHQRRLKVLRQKRMEIAASSAGSKCACAASLTLERRRAAFAIYAGSIRLVRPPTIKNLNAELMSALRSPLCTRNG